MRKMSSDALTGSIHSPVRRAEKKAQYIVLFAGLKKKAENNQQSFL
jgi:hypothetical protein